MDTEQIAFRIPKGYRNLIKEFKTEDTLDEWFYNRFNEWAVGEGLKPEFYQAMAQIHILKAQRLKRQAEEAREGVEQLRIINSTIEDERGQERMKNAKLLNRLVAMCRTKLSTDFQRGWAEGRKTEIKRCGLTVDEFLSRVRGDDE